MRILILSFIALASLICIPIIFGSIYIHFYFKKERKIENEILRKEQRDFNTTLRGCKICGIQQPIDSPICLNCGNNIFYKLTKDPNDPRSDKILT
jgi:hypothetical protein